MSMRKLSNNSVYRQKPLKGVLTKGRPYHNSDLILVTRASNPKRLTEPTLKSRCVNETLKMTALIITGLSTHQHQFTGITSAILSPELKPYSSTHCLLVLKCFVRQRSALNLSNIIQILNL